MSDLSPVKTPAMRAVSSLNEPPGIPDEYPASGSSGRAQRRFAFLRRYWWIPLLTFLAALGGAGLYLLLAPPTYVSYARMWETEKLRLPDGTAFSEDVQNYFGTQIELLRSDRLAQGALARLQASGTNTVPRDKDGKPLAVQLRLTQFPKSTVFVVEGSSPNAAYTQRFLDALMEEYLAYKKNIRKVVSGDTLASISDQVVRMERDLKADEDALTAFQRTNNLAILEEEGRVAGAYLARLKTQLSDLQLEAQLLKATALEQSADPSEAPSEMNFLADAMRDPASAVQRPPRVEGRTAFEELALLKAQRDKLSRYYRPKHPDIVRLDAEIERAQKLIDLYHTQSREQLDADRKAVDMKVASVEGSIREWEGKVVQANALIAEAERLKLAVSRTQGLYDRLVVLLQNVDISRNIDQESLAILEPASPPVRSYRHEIQAASLALVGGLLAGLGIVLVAEIRDDRFTSAAEVNERFGDSIVAQVPEVAGPVPNNRSPLLANGAEPYLYAESYRTLRSALLFLPSETRRPKIVLVTSALPGEGKSTVAVNLARTLAFGGSRVLLVDGDLRKGRLHETLGMAAKPGLTEVLCHSADLERAIQSNSVPNFFFLSCGGGIGQPGDLFLGRALDGLLERFRQGFDYVVIDSCPVFAADDVSSLAPRVDGTLFVVRSRFSRARVVREALELLGQRQATVLGMVFNRADASARSYYYHKYAGYYPEAPQKTA